MKGTRTFRDLKDFIHVHRPDLVFLMETKMTSCQMGRLKKCLKMDEVLSVPRKEGVNGGFSGGLCMLWNHNIKVRFRTSSLSHIDVMVTWEDGYECRVTGFYGEPSTNRRHLSWALMRRLASEWEGPWLFCGDCNEILCASEKTGLALRPQRQIDLFREAVEDCGLYEFAFTGFEFTWDNRRVGVDNVKERLDRGFGNLVLIQHCGGFLAHHLVTMVSDHQPILIERDSPNGGNDQNRRRRKRRFLFEEMWLQEDECGVVVKQVWEHGYNGDVIRKIGMVGERLALWSKEKFWSVRKKAAEFREDMDKLQRESPSAEVLEKRKEVGAQLDVLLEREEIMWKQRSRIQWLQHGDKNTKFFHSYAKHRGKINSMEGILGVDNRWRTSSVDIGCEFVRYFRDLFSSNGGQFNDEFFSAVNSKVSEENVEFLSRPFQREEIELALKTMGATKSPGSDGLPPLFYQKFWSTVGNEVVDKCLLFLNGDQSVKEVNHTFIALIPKVDKPKKVTEYRPISLCNVLYKLMSKVLTNRLKEVLQDVISDYQSAFIPHRSIHDNVIVAFEVIHNLKRRGRKSRHKIAMKLNMAKAYDRVEWNFLRSMLSFMGFPSRFIELIMDCVETVSYSVLLQGSPFGMIRPQCGIRQGDPISPYLFLIVAEGFSSLLRYAERSKVIHGVKVAGSAPPICHLFFADDSLLFCDARRADCVQMRSIFQLYEQASGQKINLDKYAICYSPKTPYSTS